MEIKFDRSIKANIEKEYEQIVNLLGTIPISSARKESISRLKIKLSGIVNNASRDPSEKIYALFDVLATEYKLIVNSFGGVNSKLGGTLHTLCLNTFGVNLNNNELNQEGLLAKMLTSSGHISKSISDFIRPDKKSIEGVSTGGVTGSSKVISSDGKAYQLKPSILDKEITFDKKGWASGIRRMKAFDTDRENFGEVIASCIGSAILPGLVPEVSLVYDAGRKKMSVASKYLEGNKVRTLDEFAQESGVRIPNGQHAVFVAEENNVAERRQGKMPLNTNEMTTLNKCLAKAIVLSAVVGDHDVNPGNMIVVTNENSHTLARIDFGHALNDLLNAPESFGGKVRDENNPILDFFNRPNVAGATMGGAPSKLWRDYPGLVPSQALVEALREISIDINTKVKKGVADAYNKFSTAIIQMQIAGDIKGIEHMKDSLGAIYTNISGKKLDLSILTGIDVVYETFREIDAFVLKNGENLEQVANVMQFQISIDKAIKSGEVVEQQSLDLLKNYNFPRKDGKIQWIRSGNQPAFSGSIDEYIQYKTQDKICASLNLFLAEVKTTTKPDIKEDYEMEREHAASQKYKKFIDNIKVETKEKSLDANESIVKNPFPIK